MSVPSARSHFGPGLFAFLKDLKRNNRREWFAANKERYEEAVKGPAQCFISEVGPHLAKLSPSILADPRPVGGSLFRIHRDLRFGDDKTPYKTHTGVQFRHRARNDAHAPGFYLHLEPRNCFVGAGTWRPDAAALSETREAIVSHPREWKRVRDGVRFRASYALSGDVLARPPRGYDPAHPFIEDLKRKDFVALAELTEQEVISARFLERFIGLCRDAGPFVRFLCRAIDLPY
jgi:uncharacterized protein (TIGR02453 family)